MKTKPKNSRAKSPHSIATKKTVPKASAAELQRKNKAAQIARSGLNTRVRGHLKAATKRRQGKRDATN